MKPAELLNPEVLKHFCPALAKFHALDIPIPKKKTQIGSFQNWLKSCSALKFEDETKQARYEALGMKRIASEADIIVKRIENTRSKEIVFGHLDLLGENMLFTEEDKEKKTPGSLRFIDFEYGCYTDCEYDLANMLCETCGFSVITCREMYKMQTYLVQLHTTHGCLGVQRASSFCLGLYGGRWLSCRKMYCFMTVPG